MRSRRTHMLVDRQRQSRPATSTSVRAGNLGAQPQAHVAVALRLADRRRPTAARRGVRRRHGRPRLRRRGQARQDAHQVRAHAEHRGRRLLAARKPSLHDENRYAVAAGVQTLLLGATSEGCSTGRCTRWSSRPCTHLATLNDDWRTAPLPGDHPLWGMRTTNVMAREFGAFACVAQIYARTIDAISSQLAATVACWLEGIDTTSPPPGTARLGHPHRVGLAHALHDGAHHVRGVGRRALRSSAAAFW